MASSTSARPEPAAPLDVLVVGAGPAGSAAAARLSRAGCRVAVVDRASFPRDKACSEYMSPETVRLLGDLDAAALADVEGRAPARLYGMRIVAPDGAEAVGRFSSDHRWPTPWPYGLALPRADLDFVLRQGAQRAGATVRAPHRCTGHSLAASHIGQRKRP